jgi:predicted DNA-binding protein (MmcQ/YjbR family)
MAGKTDPMAANTKRSAVRRAGRSRTKGKAADLTATARTLREFAMGLPGASEHFPWGERVAKICGRVFVFLGVDPIPGGPMSLSVKLPASGRDALELPFARPTGYGLGKSGWVTASFQPGDSPPQGILRDWILESYRAVAPKKMVERLGAGPGK